ncbi:hypothetical protein GU926_08130 [Nibribacter ruber]|uniref:Uncharacterized protein n=1 Tax=Nibribacter ruber TaxID=2698458 RepID=A0A6P1P1B0_9BACT|nr:hypothetical protein [Nibribacter ruber]QHL87403.1 hypothetical protein GU926_08130 [Nibribacter ruber]
MHEVKIGTLYRQLPSDWNELTGRQLVKVIAAESRWLSATGIPEEQKKHLLRLERLRILLNLPLGIFLAFTPIQIVQLHWLVKFLDSGFKGLTAQLLPRLRVPGIANCLRPALFGPRERFRSLSFLEFIYADTYFMSFTQKQTPEKLDRFVACLYREKRWFHFIVKRLTSYGGDCRQEFNQHLVERRAQLVARLPLEVKLAVLSWYRGCRFELEGEFPLVFSEGTQKKAGRSGWDGVLLGMSGHVINIEATGRANIRNILAAMQQRFEQIEEQERRNNENN